MEGASDKRLARDFEGAAVEGVELANFSSGMPDFSIPLLVTFLGGAIATILTEPRGRDLMMASASDCLFPSKLSSLMEIR